MNNILRIKRKMEKVYKRPIDNIYSHSFYSELFSGYEYSLSEEKINRRDFYIIIPDDKEIVELFGNGRHYDFSYEFSQSIDRVLYSMAVYGKAYIFVKPDYINESDANGKEIKKNTAPSAQKRMVRLCLCGKEMHNARSFNLDASVPKRCPAPVRRPCPLHWPAGKLCTGRSPRTQRYRHCAHH